MKIKITSDDIYHGICNDGDACPIALAVARHIPGYSLQVDAVTVTLFGYDGESQVSFDVPEVASDFIRDFDAIDENVMPFEFELEGVDEN